MIEQPKPTIKEIEKLIESGVVFDILPNGQIQREIEPPKQSPNNCNCSERPKIHTIECVSKPEQPTCETCGGTREVPDYGEDVGGVCGAAFEVSEVKKPCPDCPEQPNTELLIVKTIQGLMACINNELVKLLTTDTTSNIERIALRAKALEDIDLFEKTTLYELQKAFE